MKIYVAMHKIFPVIKDETFEPILVGSFNKKVNNVLRDDTGINISSKNENYCELTALYWIWKNSNEDIIGLCHYRRFLSKKSLSNNSKYYVKEYNVLNDFKNGYNMILPKKNIYTKSIEQSINIAPNVEDMQIVRKCLNKLYPEYDEAFNKYMKSYESYLCNVMITSKQILDEYCQWLFRILDEVEKTMDKNTYINDPYRKRMFGFLAERLLNVWLIYNEKKLKIKEYPLINTEQNFIKKFLYVFKQLLKKMRCVK